MSAGNRSKKMRPGALLGAVLLLTALVYAAGCDRHTGPVPAPTEAPEGNVALGRPVTLVNVEVPNGGDLTDGDRETAFYGEINYRKSAAPQLVIDLGSVVRVKRVDLYPAQQDGFFGRYFPSEIVVRLSTDGTDYTEVCRYSNVDAPDCVPVLEFDARDARYVVLDIQSRAAGENGFGIFELAEIEVVSAHGEYAYPE